MNNRRRILVLAFHFPPLQGSSGLLRILSLLKRLRETDWEITVLTASRFAYVHTESSGLKNIPDGVKVVRAFSLHNPKHLSVRGKYIRWLSIPDNWGSWIPFAFVSGAIQILRMRPALLFATYPIASTFVVSSLLKRIFGLPLVADFRDPMLQDDYPRTRLLRSTFASIERRTVFQADMITVTTPGSQRLLVERYGETVADKIVIVENGVDVTMYQKAEEALSKRPVTNTSRKVLLHSGLVYPIERNPSSLFRAIAEAKRNGVVSAVGFELRLRGCGHERYLSDLAASYDITDLVSILPPVPYLEAAKEVLCADGLLVLQSADCNNQIPGKVYEYLYTAKPIFALTHPKGDTGLLLANEGVTHIVPLEDEYEVSKAFRRYIEEELFACDSAIPRSAKLPSSFKHSREVKAALLEGVLLELVSPLPK